MLGTGLSGGSRKAELFDNLFQSIEQTFGDTKVLPFHEWVEKSSIILDGKPFSFERHEYLRTPYQDDHPHIVEKKAAQMGLTSKAMLRTIYSLQFKKYRGVLYLFPSRSDVLDFSKGRISPLIEENEEIARMVRDTDSAGIKAIGKGFLYLRGMKSRIGLKSIPADFLIFDELDEAPQNAVDMAMERMSHSEYKEVWKLSNPTLPDYGIDKAFQETDQRHWLLKCEKCGESTCLEDTFPDCLLEIGGRVIRACGKCKAELNPALGGEWVAKKPSISDKRGYHYSQLFSQFVSPAEILHQFRTTTNLTDFYNLKIGVAYVEAENRLSIQEVLALCGNDGIVSQDPGPCSMGVDQGKDLHVVIEKRDWIKAGKIIHLGIYKDWEELDRLMKVFHVTKCVVDALPETRNARAFAERHKGKVFLNYYSEHQKGKYAWNEKDLTVTCNRTESLDASHNEIMNSQIILPKECEIVREFATHLHNVAKKLEEDEETGSKRYIYVKFGPDHFRHALNYKAMARGYGSDSCFGDCDLT
jgi:hypothetical protein